MATARNLAALQVKLDLNAAAFDKGMKSATNSMGRMTSSARRTNQQLATAAASMKRFIVQAAAFAGIGFGVQFLRGIISVNSELAKSADIVGLTVENFQEMQFAAERTGVAASQFTSNMGALTKRLGELKADTGPLVAGLRNLDGALLENLKTANGNAEALDLIADAIQNAETATDRARIANATFSRSGLGMINMLKDGSEGLREFSKEARELGIVMEERLVRQAEDFDDRLSDLSKRMKTTVGAAFLGAISSTVDQALGFIAFLVAQFQKAWVAISTTAKLMALNIQNIFAQMIEAVLVGLKRLGEIGGRANPLARFVKDLPEFGDANKKFAESVKAIEDAAKAQSKAIDENAAFLINYNQKVVDAREETARLKREMARDFALNVDATGLGDANDKIEETVAALDDMDRAFDLIIGQFEELDAAAAAEFAGLNKGIEETTGELNAMTVAIGTMVADGIGDMVDGFFDAKNSFEDFARSFLENMAKMIIQQQILNALSTTAFGAAAGIEGRMAGGPVAGGIPYLVGEAGPELFTPASSGSITSNDKLGGNTTVNVINNTDSKADVRESRNAQGDTTIDVLIEQAVKKSVRRGGLDSSFSSVYGISRRGF